MHETRWVQESPHWPPIPETLAVSQPAGIGGARLAVADVVEQEHFQKVLADRRMEPAYIYYGLDKSGMASALKTGHWGYRNQIHQIEMKEEGGG